MSFPIFSAIRPAPSVRPFRINLFLSRSLHSISGVMKSGSFGVIFICFSGQYDCPGDAITSDTWSAMEKLLVSVTPRIFRVETLITPSNYGTARPA